MNKLFQIVILVFIAFYLFYGLDIGKINFYIFSVWGLFFTLLSIFASQMVLVIRWRSMSNLSFKISYETIVVSSAINMILPARLGELSKAFYLKKFYKYSYHKSISIVFIERFFDLVVLFLIMCLWAYDYFADELLKNSILFLSIIIILIVGFFNSKKVLELLKKIPFRWARIYAQKIYKNINKLLRKPYYILFYTVVLWSLYLLSNIVFFIYGVEFHLSFGDILELFIFSTIALSIPLAPAGIGTFEGAIVLFLTHHGVSKEEALISAMMYHLLIFVVDFALFYLLLLFKNIKFKDLVQK